VLVNVKLILEYDGSNYHGWQVQANCISIQAVLEKAVSTFLGAPTHVTGSGRTDAGVHALGQVANFFTAKDYQPYRILRGLNALTPRDITVKTVEIVDDGFDARRDGRSRLYEYLIFNRPTPSPFHRNRAWHIHEPLDVDAMAKAIDCLVGEHDFSSFRAANCDAPHPIRTIYQSRLEKRGDLLVFTIEGTAFLRHMVRNIVGTLADVGRGIRTPQSFAKLLDVRDRTQAGYTAPPDGLYLVHVKYDPSKMGTVSH
jgi:tRNA pseudouridine38-40 synthase